MTAGRHCETKAKTFHSLFGYYPVVNIMSVHHCSFMSDNIVTFNEILTLLCHVPDSSALLQTMSNSLPEYYGARLKVPFQSSFFVSLSYWQCDSSNTGHNIAWSPRQQRSSLLATFDSLGHISPPPIGDDLSYLLGMW